MRLLCCSVTDILDFSKIEAGELTLHFSAQNIGDVVEAAVMLCYEVTREDNVQCQCTMIELAHSLNCVSVQFGDCRFDVQMAKKKNLSLCWFVDPILPPSLLLDSTRLQQILLNLLSNAIKVNQRSGKCRDAHPIPNNWFTRVSLM
jgi:signal transduction histidine kinase